MTYGTPGGGTLVAGAFAGGDTLEAGGGLTDAGLAGEVEAGYMGCGATGAGLTGCGFAAGCGVMAGCREAGMPAAVLGDDPAAG